MEHCLPLFPLHRVLLPGAGAAVRVFEPRYLDMVRECGRQGRGFGVCLILDGEETGQPATPAAYGTEAVIEDFGSTPEGLLTLKVRGKRRFHVQRTRIRDSGLIIADVQWLAPDPDDELRPEHGLLSTVLQKVIEHVGGEHLGASAAQFDEAAWIGWRLLELLPLEEGQRQALLQVEDPHVRLDRLLELMP